MMYNVVDGIIVSFFFLHSAFAQRTVQMHMRMSFKIILNEAVDFFLSKKHSDQIAILLDVYHVFTTPLIEFSCRSKINACHFEARDPKLM